MDDFESTLNFEDSLDFETVDTDSFESSLNFEDSLDFDDDEEEESFVGKIGNYFSSEPTETEIRADESRAIQDRRREEEGARLDKISDEEETITFGDVGAAAMSGAAGVYENTGYVINKAGKALDSEGIAEYGAAVQNTGKESKDFWQDKYSDRAKETGEEKFVERDATGNVKWENTISNLFTNWEKTAMSTSESAAGTMAGMALGGGAGTLITKLGIKSAVVADAAGFGIGEGAMSAAQGAQQVEEKVMKMTHKQLLNSEEYTELYEQYKEDMSDVKAKSLAKVEIAEAAALDAAKYNFATTAAMSAPAGAVFSKVFRGTGTMGDSVGGGMAKGAGVEGVQEFGQSGAEQIGQNQAIKENANPNMDVLDNALEQSLSGMMSGAAMGGGISLAGDVAQWYDQGKQEAIRLKTAKDRFFGENQPAQIELTAEQIAGIQAEADIIAKDQKRFQEIMAMYPDIKVPSSIVGDIKQQREIIRQFDEYQGRDAATEQADSEQGINLLPKGLKDKLFLQRDQSGAPQLPAPDELAVAKRKQGELDRDEVEAVTRLFEDDRYGTGLRQIGKLVNKEIEDGILPATIEWYEDIKAGLPQDKLKARTAEIKATREANAARKAQETEDGAIETEAIEETPQKPELKNENLTLAPLTANEREDFEKLKERRNLTKAEKGRLSDFLNREENAVEATAEAVGMTEEELAAEAEAIFGELPEKQQTKPNLDKIKTYLLDRSKKRKQKEAVSEDVGEDGLNKSERYEFEQINEKDEDSQTQDEKDRLEELMDKVEATYTKEEPKPEPKQDTGWVKDAIEKQKQGITSDEHLQRSKDHLAKLEETYKKSPSEALKEGLKIRKKLIDDYEAKQKPVIVDEILSPDIEADNFVDKHKDEEVEWSKTPTSPHKPVTVIGRSPKTGRVTVKTETGIRYDVKPSSLSPATKPKKSTTKSTSTVGKAFVGKNEDGTAIREDEHGVRYYFDSGVKISEPVSLDGRGNVIIPTTESRKKRNSEFLTVEEKGETSDQGTGKKPSSNDVVGSSTKPRVPTGQSSVSDTSGVQTDQEQVQTGGKRPDEDVVNGGTSTEVSPEDAGVGGSLPNATPEHQNGKPTNADGLVSGVNEQKNIDLNPLPPVALTKGQRKKINDQVLEIIKKPVEDVTAADREILRQYTGEGGLGEVNVNTINQHYTNYETVRAMYKAINDAGIPTGRALEPAVGSGNFVGMNPKSTWDAVDIDSVNIEVVKRLYPEIKNLANESYETFKGKNYDLIISNVPFASEQTLMREHAMTILPGFKAIHNFYFAQSLGKVKDNGVIAFMTSTGTMDGTTNAKKLRQHLMDNADLIGAYRLPAKSQAKNAHTDTMIDIIYLQKRPSGVESRQSDINTQFINIGNKDGFPLNEYFIAHPENMLGTPSIGKDKTKMGKEGWIVTGEPQYDQIELDYKKYDPIVKVKESKTSFNDTEQAIEYAQKHGLVYKNTPDDTQHIDIKTDAVILFDTPILFQESEQSAMFGKVLKTVNAKKILQLNRIMTLTEDGLKQNSENLMDTALAAIENYKETFPKNPHNDKALKTFMGVNKAGAKLNEYMSYFDANYKPAPIYKEKVRFKDSGEIEITDKSNLDDKALFYGDADGVIDTSKAYEHLSAKDIDTLVKSGKYLRSKDGEVQLKIFYYSGNIYEKMDQLEEMEQKKQITTGAALIQGAKLKKILPEKIKFKSIRIKGSESWLPQEVKDSITTKNHKGELSPTTGWLNGNQTDIYAKYLNGKALAPKKKDETDQENVERTMAAQDILHNEIMPAVKTRVESKGLKDVLEEQYNRASNFYVRPKMTGELLRDLPKQFRGKPFKMQSHQAEGAEKIVFNKKGVIAFAPGGGKTITAIVAVKQLLDQGVMKKPLFVVPVNTIAQWEETVKELYPDAKVFQFPKYKSGVNKGKAKDWANLSKAEKDQMAQDLANTRYDYTIIGDSMFQKMGLPKDVLEEYIDDLIDDLVNTIEDPGQVLTKAQEKEKLAAEQKRAALKVGIVSAYDNSNLDFVKLGFDGIIADEVQYYKNVGYGGDIAKGGLGGALSVKMKDKEGKALTQKEIDKGAQVASAAIGSARSYDFRFKTKYVSQTNNGNNVILLTGTPTPNKPLELLTLFKHLDENILKEYGIETAKDFVDTFYDIENYETVDSAGRPVKREGLGSMKNLDWMSKIVDRYIDYKSFKDMPDLPRPAQEDIIHYLKLSPSGEKVFQDVQHRLLQSIEDSKLVRQGQMPSENMEPVIVSVGVGRSASIDLRLYDVGSKEKSMYTSDELAEMIQEDIQTEDNNKILKTVSLVADTYKNNHNSGQIIFLDRITVKNPDGSTTSTHEEIRDKILATGEFTPQQVVYVNGKNYIDPVTGKRASSIKPEKLQQVMNMYNNGDIKVVIGNTAKMGVGVDLNRKTTDIYQIDIPFRPDEIEQRNNRGVRQGNENQSVNVHQFFQLGTFDQRSYDIVIAKRGFNDMYGFSNNEAPVTEEGVGVIGNNEITDPYQAIIDLESNPFERERLRMQRDLDKSVANTQSIQKAINTLDTTHSIKKGTVRNYEDAIKGAEKNLKPENFPKYEGVKDKKEVAEKIEKYKQGNKNRIEKYKKSIEETNAEIEELANKLRDRRQELIDKDARNKFIKDEFTEDGQNVSLEKVEEGISERDIVSKEEKAKADMRPAFATLDLLSPFTYTQAVTEGINFVNTMIYKGATSHIENTRFDKFMRRYIGASKAGLGLTTRAQEDKIVAEYRTLQGDLAKSDMSAEKLSEGLEEERDYMDEDEYNQVAVQYLENPEARGAIQDIYPDFAEKLDIVREYVNELSTGMMQRGIIKPSQYSKWEDRYLSRLYLPNLSKDSAASITRGLKKSKVQSGRKIDSIIDYLAENPDEADRLGAVIDIEKIVQMTVAKSQSIIALDDFLRNMTADTELVADEALINIIQIMDLPTSFSPFYAKDTAIPYIQDLKNATEDQAEIDAYDAIIEDIKAQAEDAQSHIESMDLDGDKLYPIPKDTRYGTLAGIPVSKDVASLVMSQYKIVSEPAMFADKLDQWGSSSLAWFKTAKVPLNFFSYSRNLVSNVFQWGMSGADIAQFPTAYGRAAWSYKTKDDWYTKARSVGLIGDNMVTAEINNALDMMIRSSAEGYSKKFMEGVKKLASYYGLIDDIAKIARMRYAMEKQGKDEMEAVAIAQDTHYDYSLTYDAIRQTRDPDLKKGTLLKLLMTLFPTYTQKTIAFLYDTMLKRPMTLVAVSAALALFTHGDDDENREEIGKEEYDKIYKTLPPWIRNNKMIRVDMKRQSNGKVQITLTDVSYVVPFGSLFAAAHSLVRGEAGEALSALGAGGSPLQMAGNLKVNMDSFTGRQIYTELNGWEKSWDIATYLGKQFAPGTITKLYSLNETRHPIIPRLVGINTYVYGEEELERRSQFAANKALQSAGKEQSFFKRKIERAESDYKDGKISLEDLQEVERDNIAEIKKWRGYGEEKGRELFPISNQEAAYKKAKWETKFDMERLKKISKTGDDARLEGIEDKDLILKKNAIIKSGNKQITKMKKALKGGADSKRINALMENVYKKVNSRLEEIK